MKSYEDFKQDINKPVVDYNNPKCVSCNDCCGNLTLLSQEEYENLKRYFTKSKVGKSIYETAIKRVISMMKEHDALYMQCPLSSREKKCAIYNKRPSVCRDFHCKTELNLVEGNEKQRVEKYGGRFIFELFKEDLLKNEEYKERLRLLTLYI